MRKLQAADRIKTPQRRGIPSEAKAASVLMRVDRRVFVVTHYPQGWDTIPAIERSSAQRAVDGPGWFTFGPANN